MRSFLIAFFFFTILFLSTSHSQTTYNYDEAGNRIGKTITLGKVIAEPGVEENRTVLEEMKISLFPNPTEGIINIKIDNAKDDSELTVQLFDMLGNELFIPKSISSDDQVDISEFANGTYILRIKVNEEITDWQVIKKN